MPCPQSQWIRRIVVGCLSATIHNHGPVTHDLVSSAADRIVGQLCVDFDRILAGYQPRRRPSHEERDAWWRKLRHGMQDGN